VELVKLCVCQCSIKNYLLTGDTGVPAVACGGAAAVMRWLYEFKNTGLV